MYANLEDIRETLTASGAPALVPKIIDRLLLEYVRKQDPFAVAFPHQTWLTNTYYFNQRNQLPQAQSTTEAPPTSGTGSVAASQSNYVQNGFNIQHTQVNLDISIFAAKVALVNGNLFDLEIAGGAKSLQWYHSMLHLYGMQNATLNTKRPQWNGVDYQIGSANKINGNAKQATLASLDSLIDSIRGVAAQDLGSNWFFAMSNKMQSTINRAFVNQVRYDMSMSKIFRRDDYGIPGAAVSDVTIGVDAGLEVQTYRGIPIVVSSFLSNQGQMGSISTTNNTGTGSSLSTSRTYYYVVEAVTRYGQTFASAEVSASPSSSGKNIVLSWSTPTPLDAFGNTIDIIGYRIYRSLDNGGGSGAETLYALSAAYDTNDAAVTAFTDSGLIQDPTSNTALYAQTVASSGGNAVADGATYPRTLANSEDILLLPRDPEYLVVPTVREMETELLAPVNARTRQFAIVGDLTLAMRAGLFGAKLYNITY